MSNKTAIKMFNPSMAYRRFGRSGKPLSVITLGGMRYVNGWGEPRHEVPDGMIQQCTNCVQQAFAHGFNHIETAHGYGKSEHCYGIVLQQLGIARDAYYLMTKGDPKSAEDTRRLVEEQLTALRTDRIDFYAWHGINTPEFFETACCAGGPVEELLKMKQEGTLGHRDRPVRIRQPSLLLLFAAQPSGGRCRRGTRHGRLHHLPQQQGRSSLRGAGDAERDHFPTDTNPVECAFLPANPGGPNAQLRYDAGIAFR
jgi:hypothetical protein